MNDNNCQLPARNPQKYEVNTMPRNETEAKIPCSVIDKCKSHLAYVITYEKFTFSKAAPIVLRPVKIINNI